MKNLSIMNKGFLTLLFTLSITGLFAQQSFKYRAPLPKIDSDNFYRIVLPPSLTAKSQTDLSDIRINDQNNKPVPYIFGDKLPIKDQQNFVALPQISKTTETDTSTIFIAQNTNNFTINQLYLTLRNTAVERTVNLSGSDDLKNWYAIKENIGLTEAGTTNGLFKQLLNFPSSTYRYFKIQINHKNQEPVAILQAGIYKDQRSIARVYTALPVASFTQKDTDKYSYVTIRFSEAYPINKLNFEIAGSKYFNRDVRIYQLIGKTRNLIGDAVISSITKPTLFFSAKATTLQIEIANNDNPPLNITAVNAFQLGQSLICYLEKKQQYHILVGDSTATTPDYDLKSFTDSLNQILPVINPGTIGANPAHQIKVEKVSASIPAWVIWVAIAVVVGILALLTFKMTKELNKREA
jgi:hypothetical protein